MQTTARMQVTGSKQRIVVNRVELKDDDLIQGKKVKRLRGLYQINTDLDTVLKMVERALKEPNLFLDYPGIAIKYRKCFTIDSDARGTSLSKKHLKGATENQNETHDHLMHISNKHVAHSEDQSYDKIRLMLHINAQGKAFSIAADQDIYEPIITTALKELLDLINLIKTNLAIDLQDTSNSIINEYNEAQITSLIK